MWGAQPRDDDFPVAARDGPDPIVRVGGILQVEQSGAFSAPAPSAAYRAVAPTLIRAATSRTVRPWAIGVLARWSFSSVTTGRRPPRRPRAAASSRPARVRSRMRSRSNCPRAPKMRKMSRPPGAMVSIASVRERKPTPRASCSALIYSLKHPESDVHD